MPTVSPQLVATMSTAAATLTPTVLEWTKRIASVPAPTFDESARASLVRDVMREQGLAPVVDGISDLVGTITGTAT